MLRKFLVTFFLLTILPVTAGQYEEALKSNDKIFLYLYTPTCSYCVKFNPIYKKIAKDYKDGSSFLKINAETQEGFELMRQLGARFVPYVVLVDNKKQTLSQVSPSCLLDSVCINYVMNKFVKQ